MRLLSDLAGKRFGKLVVLKHSHKNERNEHHWLCRCDCGNQSIVRGANLRTGHTVSCGNKKIHSNLPEETVEELERRIEKTKAHLESLLAKRKAM